MKRSAQTCSALLVFLAAAALPSLAGAEVRTNVWISGKVLKVRDGSTGPDYANQIYVKVKRDEHAAYVAEGHGTAVPGKGCFTVTGEDTSAGNPEDLYPQNPLLTVNYTVKCPFTDLRKVDINSGPGDDLAYVVLSHVPVRIVGGAGNDDLQYYPCTGPPPYWANAYINGGLGDDFLVGGPGDDVINGSRGYDFLTGSCGSDRMYGGPDLDSFIADETDDGGCNTDCAPASDRVYCGNGETVEADGLDVLAHSCTP